MFEMELEKPHHDDTAVLEVSMDAYQMDNYLDSVLYFFSSF